MSEERKDDDLKEFLKALPEWEPPSPDSLIIWDKICGDDFCCKYIKWIKSGLSHKISEE